MQPDAPKKVLIIAGEASGDLHGSNLVREIRKQEPAIAFSGVGSKRMREAGVDLLADASQISVVGATEVLTHLRPIYGVYARLKRYLREERPSLLILIDFPDFNILVGKVAKKLGIPIVYFISPQVWAWRKGRIKTIARLVKAMIVIFPFERELYAQAGVDVRFVGHPLVDVAVSAYTKEEARKHFGLAPDKRTIALLPGSRKKEIDSLLPDMLGAADVLKKEFPDLQFILPIAPTLERSFLSGYLERSRIPVLLVGGNAYDALRTADAAIVASGTATLETGLMAVPMVIVYRISAISYGIAKALINVAHVGLVNIVAGKRIVPELLQRDVNPDTIAANIAVLLRDQQKYTRVTNDLAALKVKLGSGGASTRAAAVVREMLA